MSGPYVYFYLLGREDEPDADLDVSELVAHVLAGKNLREVAYAAAKAVVDAEAPAGKPAWLEDNVEDIAELGGDADRAYRLYLQGLTDAFAIDLEADLVEEVIEALDDLDDEDEDPDGDDVEEEDDVEEDEDADDEDEDSDDDEDPEPVIPIARVVNPGRAGREPSQQAKYRAWETDGRLDAVNSFESDAYEIPQVPVGDAHKLATQLVDAFWAEERKGSRKVWMSNHRDDVVADGLNPNKAWHRWEAGWRPVAVDLVEKIIRERQAAA